MYQHLFQMKYEVLQTAFWNCPNLEHVDLAGLKVVTQELMFDLAENCPKLRKIGIKGCFQVT